MKERHVHDSNELERHSVDRVWVLHLGQNTVISSTDEPMLLSYALSRVPLIDWRSFGSEDDSLVHPRLGNTGLGR